MNQEKALIIAELYLKGQWRFAAVAQGFNEGLSALLKHFGGEETEQTSSPPPLLSPPPSAPPPPISPPPLSPPPPLESSLKPKVSLSKVTLEKKGDKKSISLDKITKNVIHVNLNWDAPEPKKFSFLGSKTPPDLDLGCMYRLKDGSMGVIQPLGNNFGSSHQPPFILLDKDDRSGSSASGENLRIYNGRVTVTDQKGNEVYIKLDSPDPRYAFCSVCSFKNTGSTLDLIKEELYFSGHSEADRHFGFGFRWSKGSK